MHAQSKTIPVKEARRLELLFRTGRHDELKRRIDHLMGTYPACGRLWKILAVSLVAQGKEALPALQRCVDLSPDDIEAHNNLAHVLQSRGMTAEALEIYLRSLKIDPNQLDIYTRAGNIASTLGRPETALSIYQQALLKYPESPILHNNIAGILLRLGQFQDCESHCRIAVQSNSDFAEAYCTFGNVLFAQSRYQDAITQFQRAVSIKPSYPVALHNLGNTLLILGQFEEARNQFQLALQYNPHYAEAYCGLGQALHELQRYDDAMASYRHALSCNRSFSEAHNRMGMTYMLLGQWVDAEAAFQMALKLGPRTAGALNNLGNAQKSLGNLTAAIDSYRDAGSLEPASLEIQSNLAHVLKDAERYVDAVSVCQQILNKNAEFTEIHKLLGDCLSALGVLEQAESEYRCALSQRPNNSDLYSNLLFCMLLYRTDPEMVFAEHCRYGARFESALPTGGYSNSAMSERQLNVGIVSGDFRNHAVTYFVGPILLELAKDPRLSLHFYYNHTIIDEYTQRLQGVAAHWHNISDWSLDDRTDLIRSDGIDILIDLSGHTDRNCLLSFAKKPAPVEVTWIGYPNTTGLKNMDYVLTDFLHAPTGLHEQFYTEKFARIPSATTYSPPACAPEVSRLPALSNAYVTFASFHRPSKINDQVISVWSRVLMQVPNAKLLLGNMTDQKLVDLMAERFARHGIERIRLQFYPTMPLADYLALHHTVDVLLDTWPYSGGAITRHALWMGVPVVTMRGPGFAHCQGAAVMEGLRLPAWIADDADDFVRIAAAQTADLNELAVLRANLRERWRESPCFDPGSVAAGVSAALRQMWRRWCSGLPPVQFDWSDTSA